MLLNKMGKALALDVMEEMTYLMAELLLSYTMLPTSFMIASICINMVRHAVVMDRKQKHCHVTGEYKMPSRVDLSGVQVSVQDIQGETYQGVMGVLNTTGCGASHCMMVLRRTNLSIIIIKLTTKL